MSFDLRAAIAYNRHAASRVGWGDHATAIEEFLRQETGVGQASFPARSPSEEDFARAVAEWQRGGGLVEDGKLGPNSWNRMSREIVGASPGRVQSWSKGPLQGGLLSGFDLDEAALKPRHEEWLASFAQRIPTLSADDVYVIGMTDKSGSKAHNLALSRRRANSALGCLRARMPFSSEARLHPVGAGEHFAQGSGAVASADRGVAVAYEPVPSAQPLPSWLTEMQRPQPQTRFYCRCTGGYVGSGSVLYFAQAALTQLAFLISDGFWTQRFFLPLAGAGVGVSASPLPLGFTALLGGPWHTFKLSRPRTVNDFDMTYVTMRASSVDALHGAQQYGACALSFERPSFDFDPFLMGSGIKIAFGSAGAQGAYGSLDELSKWAIRGGGPPAEVQRHLKRGGPPGPASMP